MATSHHSAQRNATDIRADGWIRRLPVALRALALLSRWDRPIGFWLLLAPAMWGLVMAAQGVPSAMTLMLFVIGALMMRGAGCTLNDLLDRELDGRVARTASRPLPARMISIMQAWVWLTVQLCVAAIVLFMLPVTVWLWGVAAVPLVLTYPFMKRITWWPQAWLGMTFNWGLFLGAASRGEVPSPATLLLFAGAVAWTIGYDTIYATQDAKDDMTVGVKSTARLFGANVRPAIITCYGVALALWTAGGVSAQLSLVYFMGLVGVALLFGAQFRVWRMRGAGAAFIYSRWTGLGMTAALLAGYLV